MSMLLEALKKSEEQRQMGKAPDIHAPDDHGPADSRGAPWVPVAMMAVAAVAITYLVWDQYRPPAGMSAGDAAQDAVSISPQVAERPAPEGQDGSATDAPTRTPSPVESFRSPGEASDAAAVSDEQRKALAESFEEYAAPGADEPEGTPRSANDASVTPPASRPARGILARPAPRQAEEPPAQGAVSYWELPQNVRDSMPDFNITVLVFAERPEDRFLLMNGRRLVENDQVDGVRLEKIRRDGAVFRYRDYLFKVED